MSNFISQFFSADHQRLDLLFQAYLQHKTDDFELSCCYFNKFKQGLEQHIEWEESLLFPQFENATGMVNTGPTEVMRREHEQIRELLNRLNQLLLDNQETANTEDGLMTLLDVHNQKEEQILYAHCDRLITEDAKSAMLLDM